MAIVSDALQRDVEVQNLRLVMKDLQAEVDRLTLDNGQLYGMLSRREEQVEQLREALEDAVLASGSMSLPDPDRVNKWRKVSRGDV